MTDRLPPTPSNFNAELEAIVLSQGGLFWLEGDHEPWIRQLFHAVVNRLRRHVAHAKLELYKDKPREIEFGFMCSSSLNAFAYASPETDAKPFDFIGINVGVIFTLLHTFSRILSNPHTFVDIGSPQIEKESLASIPFLSTDIMKSNFDVLVPVCPIRSIFAGELTQVAIDYLFFHELTHLRNGHLEFTRRHLAMTAWMEAVSEVSQSTDKMVRQTLEIDADADAGAILHTLNHVYRLNNQFISTTRPMTSETRAGIAAAYGSQKKAVRILCYASYFVFRLFDTPTWMAHQQQSYTHPFPPLRMFYIGVTIYEIFRTRVGYQYDANEFAVHNAEIIKNAEIDCGLIQDKPPNASGILSVMESSEQALYMKTFKKTWREIRPVLEQYKRGGKLAE